MGNDLINRSALIDELKQSGMIVDNDYGNAMVDFIKNLPTAYDVGKVKEHLNKLKEIYPTGNGNYEYAVRVDKAIEAVEAGGLNEQ